MWEGVCWNGCNVWGEGDDASLAVPCPKKLPMMSHLFARIQNEVYTYESIPK